MTESSYLNEELRGVEAPEQLSRIQEPRSRSIRVSIVVPAHNAQATIQYCVQALLKQDIEEPHEIIVVDDGSTDLTARIVAAFPHVKLLSKPHNGRGAARNAGVRAANGELILFTDADCEPVQQWASSLVLPLRNGADGVKGAYRTRQRSLTARFVQAEYESKYRRMARMPRIDFVDTYSAGYRRDILLEVSGFDESLSLDEDQELSFRLAERGYEMRFVPDAVVFHSHADTLTGYLYKKFWIGYWKVRVAALHPGRIARDSHTPQSIKVQMALLSVGAISALLSPFSATARRLAAGCGALFAATAIPFSARLARRDPALAAATPAMMIMRAAGLTSGFCLGLGRFGRQLALRAGYAAAKRGLDLLLATTGLIVCLPAMALIAAAIKLESEGPVLFVQWRAGRDGKPFRIYKFRTMVDGANLMRADLVRARDLEEPVLKFRQDPRVTRVGRVLRRWSLDELPQLVNVLRGEMSMVGPRPEEMHVVEMYSPWHRERLRATPGITGPMQVSGRADLPLDERVRIELDYINRSSIIEDLSILRLTIPAVLSGKGCY